MFIGTIVGIVSATTRPPISRARRDACQLASSAGRGPSASTTSRFQFSGRLARGRQATRPARPRGSSKPLLAAVEDALERGARPCSPTTSHRARISSSSAPRGRHPLAVAVAVQVATRRWTGRARPAERLGQHRRAAGPAPRQSRHGCWPRRPSRGGAVRCDRAGTRRSPRACRRARRGTRRSRCHATVTPSSSAAQRHALDLGEQPPVVVGVAGVQRGEAEAAVAADHGRDAVHVRRRRERIPEQLGVVVGVEVDEARADDEARRRRASPGRRRSGRRRARGRRSGRRAHRCRRGSAALRSRRRSWPPAPAGRAGLPWPEPNPERHRGSGRARSCRRPWGTTRRVRSYSAGGRASGATAICRSSTRSAPSPTCATRGWVGVADPHRAQIASAPGRIARDLGLDPSRRRLERTSAESTTVSRSCLSGANGSAPKLCHTPSVSWWA